MVPGEQHPRPAIEEGLFEDPESDEAATRSRLLMFDVLRFIDHHRYDIAIVENVVDIATNAKYALAWQVWRERLTALGYRHRVVSLNSMHAQAFGTPAPQSRDRIYIVCWPANRPAPDVERILRPKAWCPKCSRVVESRQSWKNGRTVGKYGQQYVYVHGECGAIVEPGWLPAAAAIDWSIPGERIGERLKPKTRARIAAGIARYWGPLQLDVDETQRANTYDAADPNHPRHGDPDAYYRAWPTADPLRTLNTRECKALAVPTEGRAGEWRAQTLDMPMRTQTTRQDLALAQAPFVSELRGGGSVGHSTTEPLSTVSAGGQHHALITRHYGVEGGNPARHTTPADEPVRTLTASGTPSLVVPSGGTWNEDARPTTDPLRTLTTRDAYGVVQDPLFGLPDYGEVTRADVFAGRWERHEPKPLIHRHNTGGAEMTTPASEYLRTLTAGGNVSLLRPPRRAVTAADLKAAEDMLPEVLFRMLRPHEVAVGMAFPGDYDWTTARDAKGKQATNRDLVKMAGNAVTPPAARDLIGMAVEYLTGRTVDLPAWDRWDTAA
ncbi:MAG: DNA cytosine methyltransferase [Cellulomonas sp.]|nr:DNA cytosine methyltransferase [Cellulomonas sp.]MCR6649756.1 DNA cytosine methyltransferase [Cellulomonas sp.]